MSKEDQILESIKTTNQHVVILMFLVFTGLWLTNVKLNKLKEK